MTSPSVRGTGAGHFREMVNCAQSPARGRVVPGRLVVLAAGDFLDWVLERVVVCPSGCWLWAGATSGENGRGAGYPKARDVSGTYYVHRRVYETIRGPIPPDYQIDHVCVQWSAYPRINRRCVNPDHLEAVTHVTNQHRRVSLRRKRERALVLAMCDAIAESGLVHQEEVVLRDDLSGVLRYFEPDVAQGTDR